MENNNKYKLKNICKILIKKILFLLNFSYRICGNRAPTFSTGKVGGRSIYSNIKKLYKIQKNNKALL